MKSASFSRLGAVAVAVVTAACSSTADLPTSTPVEFDGLTLDVALTIDALDPALGKVKICKLFRTEGQSYAGSLEGNDPKEAYTARFEVTLPGSTTPTTVSLKSGACAVVPGVTSDNTPLPGVTGTIQVKELASTSYDNTSTVVYSNTGGTYALSSIDGNSEGVSIPVEVSSTRGVTLVFKNVERTPEEPPVVGTQGCTPGFWRQQRWFRFYTSPWTPSSTFGAAFNTAGGPDIDDFLTGMPLSQAVALGGGGINALARHAVAALQNAASTIVDYPLTVAQVQARYTAAVAAGTDAIEAQKDEFDRFNNLGCPLGNSTPLP